MTVGSQDNGRGNTVTIGANSGGSGGGPSESSAQRSSGTSTCTFEGAAIDCTSASGTWSNARGCWVQRVSPQPEFSLSIWEGRTDGVVYACMPPGATFSAGEGTGYWFWAPDDADEASLVDPVTLAERAVDRMDLRAPSLGLTPEDPDAALLVGMDAWLWLEDAGPRGYGPITRTVTAGPVSVTARARATKVVWDLGDGTTLACRSAGTPWRPELGTGPSPTCGHRYLEPSTQEPGGAYRVRATTHWQVDWAGAGQSGVITFQMTGERLLRVTELQVLQTR